MIRNEYCYGKKAPNQGMEVDWEKRAIFSLLRRPSKSHFFIVSKAVASFSQPLMSDSS